MRIYLKILAILYLIGAFLHILDLLNLRLKFSEMSLGWKLWIVYLCFFDFAAAMGLWNQRRWGIFLFLLVAASQLIAYIGFSSFFGAQYLLISFHILTLATFGALFFRSRKVPLSKF